MEDARHSVFASASQIDAEQALDFFNGLSGDYSVNFTLYIEANGMGKEKPLFVIEAKSDELNHRQLMTTLLTITIDSLIFKTLKQ